MNTDQDSTSKQAATPTRAGRRWTIAAALAVAVGAAGAAYAYGVPAAHGPGHGHGHDGRMAMNPAAMHAHLDKMIETCAADASADQKARLVSIADAAMADLQAAHAQIRGGHAQVHALLTAPVIDRAALEQLRAAQMQRMDLVSRRLLAAVEEGAELLTPEQRTACAARLGASMH